MSKIQTAIAVICAGVLGISLAAAAPLQVALVENVTGTPAGVGFMDYVEAGKIIALGPRESIGRDANDIVAPLEPIPAV